MNNVNAVISIFMKVLNMSMTATYVMLFVLILRWLLRKMPKAISYLLWFVVFIRLICPISFASAFSLLNGLDRLNVSSGQNGLVFVPDPTNAITPILNNTTQVAGSITENMLAAMGNVSDISWLAVLATVVWILGMLTLVVYSIISYIKLHNRLADATWIHGQVYETDAVTSPFVFGFIKPKIILPVGLADEDKGLVLLHEQAHIRRCDHLIKPLFFLILALHWFNPFAWLAYYLMSQDMEMSCDETVMKRLGHDARTDYSNALLRLSLHRRFLAGSPLAFGENGTKSRVKNILNYKKPIIWIALAAIIVAFAVSISLLANPRNTLPSYVPTSEAALPQGMTVRPESSSYPVGTNEIRLIVENQTGSAFQYGSRYAIEKYDSKRGKWYQVPFAKNVAFDGLLHNLGNQDSASFYIYLNMLKSKPGIGKYRVWLLDDRATCEFELTGETATSTTLGATETSVKIDADQAIKIAQNRFAAYLAEHPEMKVEDPVYAATLKIAKDKTEYWSVTVELKEPEYRYYYYDVQIAMDGEKVTLMTG